MKSMSLGLVVALSAGVIHQDAIRAAQITSNFIPHSRTNNKRSGAARLKRKAKKLHNVRKRQSLSQR